MEESRIHLLIVHGSFLRVDRPRDLDLDAIVDDAVDKDNAALRIMEVIKRRLLQGKQ